MACLTFRNTVQDGNVAQRRLLQHFKATNPPKVKRDRRTKRGSELSPFPSISLSPSPSPSSSPSPLPSTVSPSDLNHYHQIHHMLPHQILWSLHHHLGHQQVHFHFLYQIHHLILSHQCTILLLGLPLLQLIAEMYNGVSIRSIIQFCYGLE
ncbi:hypothetical protein CsSME_00016157 [Camellia sinensis var. sinensis]